LVQGLTPPNVPGPPPHYHEGYSEVFLVLDGRMEFILDGKPVLVEAGESIDVPTNTLHTFRNTGETPCRWVNIHSPKGFLSFFEQFGVDANQPEAFEKSVDGQIINAVIEQAASYDMHIKMP
jgi:glyoxylate utilization-related uncharacterized protein